MTDSSLSLNVHFDESPSGCLGWFQQHQGGSANKGGNYFLDNDNDNKNNETVGGGGRSFVRGINDAFLLSQDDVDRMIASDMQKMSIAERQKALNDLHGIVELEDEDPTEMESLLEQLQYHLESIKTGTAYALAEAMSRPYVHDCNFRMMFLRSTLYNPEEAARRTINFFEMKKELWGLKRLCKDITLEDFNEDDMAALRMGMTSISPYKDTAGRPIVFACLSLGKHKVRESYLRANWYTYLASVMDSVDAQRRGVVWVILDLQAESSSLGSTLRESLPVLFSAIHIHYTCSEGKTPWRYAFKEHSSKYRVRTRSYRGSLVEALYQLMGYGIPRIAAPLGDDGTCSNLRHLDWIHKRMELESSQKTVKKNPTRKGETTNTPTFVSASEVRHDDVLFGRGKTVFEHPGNTRFRQIVDIYMSAHEASGKNDKATIARAILKQISQSNGRFLKRDGLFDDWVEVDVATAHKKIAHAFRNRKKFHANDDGIDFQD